MPDLSDKSMDAVYHKMAVDAGLKGANIVVIDSQYRYDESFKDKVFQIHCLFFGKAYYKDNGFLVP
jgi:hypothetical protein